MNKDELEEILNDPIFEISEVESDLFTLPEALKKKQIDEADYIAQKVVCENFEEYRSLFKAVNRELKEGKRSLKPFSTTALREGNFYIVSGVLVYLEKVHNAGKRKKSTKIDGRTRTIYEDGTESDILLNSLRKSLYLDGFIVTQNEVSNEEAFQESFSIHTDDHQDGWIYVLRSLSDEPEIRKQKDLYKIGFSTTPVAQRIQNAEYEPTYLMDKVEIVASWKTYNIKSHTLENLIHQFFSAVQFHIRVKGLDGKQYTPREWFVVPLTIIEKTINSIIDGSIVRYKYNMPLQALEEIVHTEERTTSNKVDTKGWAILSLIIKQVYFNEILSGDKTIEFRELKESTLGKYTWVEQATGSRYLKKFNALKLNVGYNKDRESALVEVIDTTYDVDSRIIEYHLGKVLEVDLKKNRKE